MLLSIGKLHVVKVPSCDPNFFCYSHYRDQHSVGPAIEGIYDSDKEVVWLRSTGLAKLKPNVQVNPKLRIDIYGPHNTALGIAKQFTQLLGDGASAHISEADPEAARKGPQTLPEIDCQYQLAVQSVCGRCAGFKFEGARTIFFDHERPAEGHIEMAGPEFHFGIRLEMLTGARNDKLVDYQNVPDDELRVRGETNPVAFTPFDIRITMNLDQARIFATTIQKSYGPTRSD